MSRELGMAETEKLIKQERSSSFPPPQSFDYSSLDQETLSFVQLRTVEIRKLVKRAAQEVIDIGNYLIEVKEKLDYGYFRAWLEAEFNWSPRTATRFMSVAQKFTADSLTGLDILPSALYVLASPSATEEAVNEAMERARQGETIAEKTAKEIKAKHKALKEQTESKVQLQNVESLPGSDIENKNTTRTVSSVSQPSSWLPEKRKIKQEILGVVPLKSAVKGTWWQLGEHHRLFCGEPKEPEFLNRLPKEIGLSISFLPKNDSSLVPPIESNSALTLYSKYDDLDLDWVSDIIKNYLDTSTEAKEIVVFNYLYYVELLELTERLRCYFWVAEPALEKCEQILAIWRKKGPVMRMQ